VKSYWLAAGLALILACPAWALQFRSTAHAAILYDAPSRQAGKVAVAGIGVPFEVFVETENWTKVRDHTGRLAWLENAALGNTRTVMVSVDEAVVRQQAHDHAEPGFRVTRGVVLEVQNDSGTGWIRVRHADGLIGWLRQSEVWGE